MVSLLISRNNANSSQVEVYCRSELDPMFMLIVSLYGPELRVGLLGFTHGNVRKFRPMGPWESAVIPSILLGTTMPSAHWCGVFVSITPFS